MVEQRISKRSVLAITDTPLRVTAAMPAVWGLPLDSDWWHATAASPLGSRALQRLRRPRHTVQDRRRLFAMEAGYAYAEVLAWMKAGVSVRGRRWADLGGDTGAHALALKLCGASEVTLVDRCHPPREAVPVLAAAGVRRVCGYFQRIEPIEVDAACLLHVPTPIEAVFRAAPGASTIVFDEFLADAKRRPRPTGWSASSVASRDLYGEILGVIEGSAAAAPAERARLTRIVWERGPAR